MRTVVGTIWGVDVAATSGVPVPPQLQAAAHMLEMTAIISADGRIRPPLTSSNGPAAFGR